MEDSIFTKIVKGELPSHKVYEDDKTLAFLDIYPVQPGMTIVVTKAQIPQMTELSDDDYTALWNTVRKVARRLHEVFPEKKRIGVQVEGLDIPHVHVKLFPIDTGAEFRAAPDTTVEPDHAELARIAARLAF